MKKKVNVLLMEPKNLLMDLTKKAIQAKPDDNYDLVIVGTATTAKAGYFELYKHRPHILFLNPELEDEDGLSFIQHALERMPYLKIVVMATRLLDKQAFLDGGAHAVSHVPIQRASLWRTIDQLIEEVDSIGLLDVSEYVPEEENNAAPAENLFQLEEEDTSYTPIFEEIKNGEDGSTEESENNADDGFVEDNEAEATTPAEVNVLDEEVVVEEDGVDVLVPKESGDGLVIIEDEETSVLDWSEPKEKELDSDKETDELLVFDPFAVSEKTNDEETDGPDKEESPPTDDSNEEELFSFDPNPIQKQEDEEINEESNDEKSEESFPIFKFESGGGEISDESGDSMDETSSNDSSFPLFDVEPNTKEIHDEQDTGHGVDELNSTESEKEIEDLHVIDLPPVEEQQPPSTDTPPYTSNDNLPEQEAEPLFQLDVKPNDEESMENSDTPVIEVDLPEYKEGSNEARTKNSLYLEAVEYNKSTLQERHSFDSGFYTRNGDFVSLYPPREQFARNHQANFPEADVETGNVETFSTPQKSEPEEGLFSSVKKLFKRR